MAVTALHDHDPLDDFGAREVEVGTVAQRVYVPGHGARVIVMAEMPGISPHVARFARCVRDHGFTVYMPSLLATVSRFEPVRTTRHRKGIQP